MAACWLAGLVSSRRAGPAPLAHRDRWIDGLRGIAAISVLASHYGNASAGVLGLAATPVFHNLGTFGVQIFFAITGYLFTRKAVAARGNLPAGPFLAARLRRIVPMYSAAVALAIAIACVSQIGVPLDAGLLLRNAISLYGAGFVQGAASIRGVTSEQLIGTIWTLPFEWLFYLFVPALAAVIRSRRGTIILFVVLALYFGNEFWGSSHVYMAFFIPGIVAGLLPAADLSAGQRGLLGITAFILALFMVLPGTQLFSAVRLVLMLGLFGALVLAAPRLLGWSGLAGLGDVSYSIYLLHFPLLFATHAILNSPHVALFAPYPRIAALLGSAALVIVLSAITYRLIERPFLRRAAA